MSDKFTEILFLLILVALAGCSLAGNGAASYDETTGVRVGITAQLDF